MRPPASAIATGTNTSGRPLRHESETVYESALSPESQPAAAHSKADGLPKVLYLGGTHDQQVAFRQRLGELRLGDQPFADEEVTQAILCDVGCSHAFCLWG